MLKEGTEIPHNRNFGLDVIRATAILLVLLAHAGISYFIGVKVGTLGVEIFFVLSGFLIGQILIKDFMVGVNNKAVLNFWVRRWFRTLPVYYTILLIKFIFFDSTLHWKVIVYFFFLQNNFVGIDFMPVSWSLVIEEWFYILIPIMILVLFRRKISKERFTIFLITFIVFENIARLLWVAYAHRGYAGIVGNFPFRLDSLMVGVMLAHIKVNYNKYYKILTSKVFYFIAVISFFTLLYIFGGVCKVEGLKDELIWTRTFWFCLISIAVALQIPFIETIQIKKTNYLGKIITWISLYTYSIYLLHPYIYHAIIRSEKYSIGWEWQVPLAMLATFCSGALVYRFYEKPIMDLRDKFKISN